MSGSRYNLRNLRENLSNPRKLLQEPLFLYNKACIHINSVFYKKKSPKGEDFIEEDWDNMIILDACRADWFKEISDIEGSFSTKISKGSESWEFMKHNFVGKSLHDTVYITSNPHSPKIPANTFHAVFNLLETDWSKEHHTVMPQDIVDKTIEIFEEYPNKRIISHFMQPHFPFIGESGKKVVHKGIEQPADEKSGAPNPWTSLNYTGESDRQLVLDAYYENHEIALKHAAKLVSNLSGKTIVTSDHANLIGEWTSPIPKRIYGHPRGLRKEELVTVPWLEIDGNRREIYSESPVSGEKINSDIIDDRLKHLGYK